MKPLRSLVGLAVLGPVLASLVLAGPAFPQAKGAPPQSKGVQTQRQPFSLTLSPTRLVVKPGASPKRGTFTVANTGSRPLHVDLSLREFSQAPNGQVTFTRPGPLSAASWVTLSETGLDLRPGERRPVRARIAVPADAEPGERQVGVLFKVPARRGRGNVSISGSVAAQLLIQVPGQVVRRTGLGALQLPTLSDGGPVQMRLEVHNRGNVHRDFIGPGARLVADAQGQRVPLPEFVVLRNSTRLIEAGWNDPPLACVCRVAVRTDDGQGHPLLATARVIVFPFRLTIGVIVAAVGLFLLLRSLRRRGHRREESRLEGARREAYERARRELGEPRRN